MGNDFTDLFGEWPQDSGNSRDDALNPDGMPEPENRIKRAIAVRECEVINIYEATYDGPVEEGGTPPKTTFVLLRDSQGRELRIYVLPDVAFAMHLALTEQTADRPYTHDLIKSIIIKLGAIVEHVTIDDLWRDTFYARISLVTNGVSLDVDSRPSDAIAIALRFNVPIYVSEAVLQATQQE
jgi:bifunctional DNase/RNase